MAPLDTKQRDAILRARVVDVPRRSLLIARIAGTAQEADLSAPTNCGGYGRIRHFRQSVVEGWPENPLPIVPAARWLGIEPTESTKAQVFQLAACAWRCWYCFVPFASMRADPSASQWLSAASLVDEYLAVPERPPILDLSGGSPDLAPEWIAWTLDELEERGATTSTFVWSDDNLSSDRLVQTSNAALLQRIATAPNYGKVCCLKGHDPTSFAFNTRAHPEGFERQFEILAMYAASGLDLYVYLPLVGPSGEPARVQVGRIADRLSAIRPDLPGRTVPLYIASFGAMAGRLDQERIRALERQWELIGHWQEIAPFDLRSP